MQIGDTLKLLRIQKGLTQEKLAQMAEMKQSAISRIEKNKGLPGVDRFEPLARALGVSPGDFFNPKIKAASENEQRPNASGSQMTQSGYVIDENQKQTGGPAPIENRVIEAYKKLEQGSSRKMAVDILLFAETDIKGNSD